MDISELFGLVTWIVIITIGLNKFMKGSSPVQQQQQEQQEQQPEKPHQLVHNEGLYPVWIYPSYWMPTYFGGDRGSSSVKLPVPPSPSPSPHTPSKSVAGSDRLEHFAHSSN